MKKTQLIEISRNIKKTMITFLAIAIIVALGVAVYLGIHFTAQGLEDTNTVQYKTEQFQDFEIVSVYGYTKEDAEAFSKLSEVEAAAGKYSLNATITAGGQTGAGKVISYSPVVSHGELREGEMPKQAFGCAVEERWAEQNHIKVGDNISVVAQKAAEQDYLITDTLKVTGIVAYIGSSKKTGTIVVPEETFSDKAFSGAFNSILLRLKTSADLQIYSADYQKVVEECREALQVFADERTRLRYEAIRGDAEKKVSQKKDELTAGKARLDEALKQIEENRAKLSQGEKEYEEGREKLTKGEKQLADGEKQLQEGQAELERGRQELEAGCNELENGRQALLEGRKKLDEGYVQIAQLEQGYNKVKQQIQNEKIKPILLCMGIPEEIVDTEAAESMAVIENYIMNAQSVSEYDLVEVLLDRYHIEGQAERDLLHIYASELSLGGVLNEMQGYFMKMKQYREELSQGEIQYTNKLQEYNEGLSKYTAGLTQYHEGLRQYEAGQKRLADARAEYEEGKQKLLDSEQKLADGREQLKTAEQSYEQKEKEYEAGRKKLAVAEKQLGQIMPVYSILLGRNEEVSYVNIGINAQNLKKLGISFAISFMFVAVMACYSSIGRMVEEQRKLLGVQKAQGFFPREILMRYMCYALSSVSVGIIGGIAAAYYFIQPILLKAYTGLGNFKKMYLAFQPGKTIIVSILVLVMAAVSVWLASRRLLKEQAVLLMKDSVPEGRGNIFTSFSFWARLPLFTRIIISNMLSEKNRVFASVAGIGGCTVLIVMGTSLKLAAGMVPEEQYQNIYQYDKRVTVSAKADLEYIESEMEKLGCESIPIVVQNLNFKVRGGLNQAVAIIAEQEELETVMRLLDAGSDKLIKIPKDGVLLSKGTADAYEIRAGDTISVVDARGEQYELLVKGIIKNYIGQRLIMEPAYYEDIFAKEARYNQYYVKLNEVTEEAFLKQLKDLQGIKKIENVDANRDEIDKLSGTLNQILIILVILSVLMAFIILSNLASMNIRQKERELAIMRVNGFTLKETNAYMMREAIAITMLGILLGLILGHLLGEQSRVMIQNRSMQLPGGIKPLALGIGAGVSGLFSVVIHKCAMRKIKKIKLTNIS